MSLCGAQLTYPQQPQLLASHGKFLSKVVLVWFEACDGHLRKKEWLEWGVHREEKWRQYLGCVGVEVDRSHEGGEA